LNQKRMMAPEMIMENTENTVRRRPKKEKEKDLIQMQILTMLT